MNSIRRWSARIRQAGGDHEPGSFWAMLRALGGGDRVPGFGRLLEEVPAG